MWIKSENSNDDKPSVLEPFPGGMMVRRNFRFVEAAGDQDDMDYVPAHWQYEEWQMTSDQYEVYKVMTGEMADTEDALIELAGLIEEVLNG